MTPSPDSNRWTLPQGPRPEDVNHLTTIGSDTAFCGYDCSRLGAEGDGSANREQRRTDCARCWEIWRASLDDDRDGHA